MADGEVETSHAVLAAELRGFYALMDDRTKTIGQDISEIKGNLKSLNGDVRGHSERLVSVEVKAEAAHSNSTAARVKIEGVEKTIQDLKIDSAKAGGKSGATWSTIITVAINAVFEGLRQWGGRM